MFTRMTHLLTVLIVAAAGIAQAADAYFNIPVRELKLVEGQFPKPGNSTNWRHYERRQAMQPYVRLDGPGEAYLSGPGANGDYWANYSPQTTLGDNSSVPPNLGLHLRAPEGQEIKGRLIIVNSDRTGMDVLRFVVPASAAKPEAKVPFLNAKMAHYTYLESRDIPGGAWFRHEARVVAAEMNRAPVATQRPFFPLPQAARQDELTRSYDLFTGGRAISENLQLDRAIAATGRERNARQGRFHRRHHDQGDRLAAADQGRRSRNSTPWRARFPSINTRSSFPVSRRRMAVADETKQHDTPVLRLGPAAGGRCGRGRDVMSGSSACR